jgi:urease accessory protein
MSFDNRTCAAAAAALVALAAGPALAHAGHDGVSSFATGLAHPVTGWDHLAAMLGVGVWAAQQQDRRALLALPGLFVAGVLGGAALALAGLGVPFVEAGILASVVLVAGLALTRAQAPLVLAGAGVGLFALAHGFAHGIEAPDGGSMAGYMAGFATMTALLHAAGAIGALLTARVAKGLRAA